MTIHLPRSFRGPVSLHTKNGSIRLSAPIQTNSTQFSDLGGVQRSFLGPFDASEFTSGQGWDGDELVVEGANGGIRIVYDDEALLAQQTKQKSFFDRLFRA